LIGRSDERGGDLWKVAALGKCDGAETAREAVKGGTTALAAKHGDAVFNR
jgi:hypothetical protein